MIAPRLLDELQQLNQEDKQELIRLLQAELADDEEFSEWDTFLKTGGVARIPSVRVDFRQAKNILELAEEQKRDNA